MDNITEITHSTPKETIDALLEHAEEGYFSLPLVVVGENKYLIARTEEERLDAALIAMEVDESICGFYAYWIAEVTGLDEDVIAPLVEEMDSEALREYLESNDKMEQFAVAIGKKYGFGCFLGWFDGKEITLDCGYWAYLAND